MSELSPASYRGQYTSRAIAFGMLGFAIVPFIGLLLVPNYSWGWRALFVFSGFGGVVIAFTRWWVPESPHWLLAHGFSERAEAVVTNAENYVRDRLKIELPPPKQTEYTAAKHYSIWNLLKTPYHKRLILFVSIWFIYYLGNYGWLTLSTSLFVDKGFKLANSIGFVTISSFGFIVGSLFPIFWGDKVPRKQFTAIVAIIWSITLFLIGWFPTTGVIIISGFVAATSIAAIIPIMYTYTAESFPTTIRATCVSVTDGLGHLGGAICGQVIFGVYTLFKPIGLGFPAAFSCMALTGILTACLLLLGKDMTKVSLH